MVGPEWEQEKKHRCAAFAVVFVAAQGVYHWQFVGKRSLNCARRTQRIESRPRTAASTGAQIARR